MAEQDDGPKRFPECGNRTYLELTEEEREPYHRELTGNMFHTYKTGWPDLLCEGYTEYVVQVFAVEVKRHPEDAPREDQLECMAVLERAGIPCFVWNKHTGFQRMGSWCKDGTFGARPWDRPFPDPAKARCATCYGSGLAGVAFKDEPQTCSRCSGSGLALRLEAVP